MGSSPHVRQGVWQKGRELPASSTGTNSLLIRASIQEPEVTTCKDRNEFAIALKLPRYIGEVTDPLSHPDHLHRRVPLLPLICFRVQAPEVSQTFACPSDLFECVIACIIDAIKNLAGIDDVKPAGQMADLSGSSCDNN